MRTINLNRQQARLLRHQLTQNPVGYDFLDIQRIDYLANKLTELQGEYGIRMAELAREEKQARRLIAKGIDVEDNNAAITDIIFEVEDLDEEAEAGNVLFTVEEGDYKLIKSKLDAQDSWLANDEIRRVIIGMVDALTNAEQSEVEGEEPVRSVKKFRRK